MSDGPGMLAASGSLENGGLRPLIPDRAYRATVQASSSSFANQLAIGLAFYAADGSVIDSVFGQGVAPGSQGLVLPPAVGLAPPGAAGVAVLIKDPEAVVGTTVVLRDADLVASPPPSPPVRGPLRVEGSRILDAYGRPVVLRGLNLVGFESSPTPPNMTEEAVAEIRAWGATMVRVSLAEQFWLSQSCAFDPGYQAEIVQLVDWITSLGMVALLDLHSNNPADLTDPSGCPAGGEEMMADNPGSLEFWSQVAAQFADDPLVAFDLYNEPHGITDSVWLHGGPVVSGTTTFTAAGMQQLYDAVRRTGARNLVVVSGNDWANEPPAVGTAQTVTGTNIAYGLHAYTCQVAPPPQCGNPAPNEPPPFLAQWDSLVGQAPVLLTEFGFPDQTDEAFNANMVRLADAQGWGWSAFGWDGTNSGEFDLVDGMPGSGTAEPSPAGMPLLWALSTSNVTSATGTQRLRRSPLASRRHDMRREATR